METLDTPLDSPAADAGASAPDSAAAVPAPAASAPAGDPWDRAYDAAIAKVAEAEPAAPAAEPPVEPAPAVAPDSKPAATSAETLAIPATDRASTAAAPEHWAAETKTQFDQLPEEARPLVLDFYKGMQATFTRGMQAIREQESALGELSGLREQFQADPKAVLAHLAKQAGLPVWFEQPLPKGETPHFETLEEALDWNRKQTLAEFEAAQKQEREAQAAEFRKQDAKRSFVGELESVAGKYPDFTTHKDGIITALAENPSLTVESAYRLATYDGLRRLALEGQAAKQELAALKARNETRKANATRPGPAGNGQRDTAANTDPWERAWQNAQARVAQNH